MVSTIVHSNETLYRTNDRGVTTQWRSWVEVDGLNDVILCTESGGTKEGSKLRVARRTIRDTGRHDSPRDHAIHQSNKKTSDKVSKEGYSNSRTEKTCSGAGSESSSEDPLPIPMRAKPLKSDALHKMALPMFAQKKIDGFRCIVSFENTEGREVTMLSRTRKEFVGFPTFKAHLCKLFDKLPKTGFGSGRFYLDGELYVPGLSFREMSSELKKGQNRPDYDPTTVQLRVFDCFDRDAPTTPFKERHDFVSQFYPTDDGSTIHVLENTLVETPDDINRLLHEFISGGDEGVILRTVEGLYEYRKQSKYMYKYKQMSDDEFRIIGFKEGEGSREGTVVWRCQANTSDKVFDVSPEGSHEHRTELFKNAQKYIGYLLTVSYQEIQDSGAPRFPVGKGLRPAFDLDRINDPEKVSKPSASKTTKRKLSGATKAAKKVKTSSK